MEKLKSKKTVLEVEKKLHDYEKMVKSKEEDPITWRQFSQDQKSDMDRIVLVKNSDFENGTLRIVAPCVLKLTESIVFKPNEKDDFFPRKDQLCADYDKFSYRLGFFAAITVETTENVVIDLNGYTLGASNMFALHQRFHSLIELGDQPFVPNAGPSDFGSDIRVAKNVWVKNGTMGRTAHHSIHGNGCENILISDLTFKDYEVAAISINGCRKVYIKNCQCDGNHNLTPVLGTFSAARYCSIFGKDVSEVLDKYKGQLTKEAKQSVDYFEKALTALNKMINGFVKDYKKALADFKRSGNINAFNNLRKYNPFFNGSYSNVEPKFYGLTDGNSYGIAIHSRGPLVNSFNCPGESFENVNDLAKALETTDIVIERTNISKTQCNVREVIAFKPYEIEKINNKEVRTFKAHIHDISGGVFQFLDTFDGQKGNLNLKTGKARLTALGKAQIALADIKHICLVSRAIKLSREDFSTLSFLLGRSNIPREVIQWAKGNGLFKKKPGATIEYAIFQNKKPKLDLQLVCNGDSMHHVNKGCIGVFLQSIDGLHLDNVVISGVQNTGQEGSDIAGKYLGKDDGGHHAQGKMVGYAGSDSRGLYIGASSNILIHDIKVFSTLSNYGSATGFQLANGNHNTEVIHPIIANCSSGIEISKGLANNALKYSPVLPNLPCKSVGMKISQGNTLTKLVHPKIEGVFNQPWPEMVNRLEINSLDTEIT